MDNNQNGQHNSARADELRNKTDRTPEEQQELDRLQTDEANTNNQPK